MRRIPRKKTILLFVITAIVSFGLSLSGHKDALPFTMFVLVGGFVATFVPEWINVVNANTEFQKGNYKKALDCSKAAISKRPDQTTSYITASAACIALRDWNSALEFCDKAIGIDPRNSAIWSNRAITLISLGQTEEAFHDVNHAISAAPQKSSYYIIRAAANVSRYQYADALQDIDKAEKLGAHSTQTLLLRALICLYTNEPDQALAYCDQFTALPASKKYAADALPVRAQIHAFRRELEKSLSDCNQVLENRPNDVDTLIGRAHTYCLAGRYVDAIEDLNLLDTLDLSTNQRAYVHSNRARVAIAQGQPVDALVDANKAINLAPTSVPIRSTLGLALSRNGQHEKALAELNTAINADTYSAEAHAFRAEVHESLGHKKNAEADRSMAKRAHYQPYL